MNVVVDANIVFSMLLAREGAMRTHLLESEHRFHAPNFVFVEIFTHKEKLLRFTRIGEAELYEYLAALLDRIRFLDPNSVCRANRLEAHALCAGIDEKDSPYVALTLELGARLWTGDRALKAGLQRRGFDLFHEPEL